MAKSVYDFDVTTLDGQARRMADYTGKTLLIVNVASACGFTPQYTGLEALHRKYRDRGFEVLGFPCNQFGGQEPGRPRRSRPSAARSTTSRFRCSRRSTSTARKAHPLFEHLKAEAPGALGTKAIKWNFTKFLVNSRGEVVERYGSSTTPEQIDADVAKRWTAPLRYVDSGGRHRRPSKPPAAMPLEAAISRRLSFSAQRGLCRRTAVPPSSEIPMVYPLPTPTRWSRGWRRVRADASPAR
jgi:glutathione peroxidase